MRGLDAWITSSRYSESSGYVTCPGCDEDTFVTAVTEYGGTEWSADRCSHCDRDFTGDEPYHEDGPDDDEPKDWELEHYGRKGF